jgi:hypothetical protein
MAFFPCIVLSIQVKVHRSTGQQTELGEAVKVLAGLALHFE